MTAPKCTQHGCQGTALRWARCRRHGAPGHIRQSAVRMYALQGAQAAAAHFDLSTSTVHQWAKQAGADSPHRTGDPTIGLTGAEAAKEVGATYRQIDYWATHRVVVPTVPANGSGTYRRYSPQDVEQLRGVVKLRRFGLPLARIAHLAPTERADLIELLETGGYL